MVSKIKNIKSKYKIDSTYKCLPIIDNSGSRQSNVRFYFNWIIPNKYI